MALRIPRKRALKLLEHLKNDPRFERPFRVSFGKKGAKSNSKGQTFPVEKERTITKVRIADIRVDRRMRPIDGAFAESLAQSIRISGQIVAVLLSKEADFGLALLDGAQRLAAAQILNWEYIDAEIVEAEEVGRCIVELAANFDRLELTALQKAEYQVKWLQLVRARGGQPALPVGGRQPRDKGFGKTAKQLGITRRGIGRSEKIANISVEAKSAAISVGLDKNQAALLAIAAMPTAAAQLQKVTELARPKKRSAQNGSKDPTPASQIKRIEGSTTEKVRPPANAPPVSSECPTAGDDLDIPLKLLRDEKQIIQRLEAVWQSNELRGRLLEVPTYLRRRFIQEVVEPELGLGPDITVISEGTVVD